MSQNEKNTTWEYNGSVFEFDLADLDCAENYETALANLQKREKSRTKDGSMSDRIREYDAMFRSLFDDLFGKGAGDAVLGESKNTNNCDAAFDNFLEFVIKQQEANDRAVSSLISKYEKYQPNRAQRRATSNVKKYKPAD